ncbi:hypothetical protein GGF43_001107 [Coemansia sp. RSA 2618]|nr:hypothetical protein GGF43_001107 [Coemansia sp. RSA 2618]
MARSKQHMHIASKKPTAKAADGISIAGQAKGKDDRLKSHKPQPHTTTARTEQPSKDQSTKQLSIRGIQLEKAHIPKNTNKQSAKAQTTGDVGFRIKSQPKAPEAQQTKKHMSDDAPMRSIKGLSASGSGHEPKSPPKARDTQQTVIRDPTEQTIKGLSSAANGHQKKSQAKKRAVGEASLLAIKGKAAKRQSKQDKKLASPVTKGGIAIATSDKKPEQKSPAAEITISGHAHDSSKRNQSPQARVAKEKKADEPTSRKRSLFGYQMSRMLEFHASMESPKKKPRRRLSDSATNGQQARNINERLTGHAVASPKSMVPMAVLGVRGLEKRPATSDVEMKEEEEELPRLKEAQQPEKKTLQPVEALEPPESDGTCDIELDVVVDF